MDSGLMLQPENNSRFGFKNSPVTKILLIASGAATLNLLFLPGNYHRIIDLNWPLITSKHEVWRLLTSQLVYDSTVEWLYGSALLYHLRLLERQWGSKKFASCILASWTLTIGSHFVCFNSKFLQPYFSTSDTMAGGLNGPLFALLFYYHKDIYNGSLWTRNGFTMTAKWIINLMAVKMMLTNNRSFTAAILGLISGVVYERNLFYVQKWLCVPDFISSLARTVYNWFVINDDTKPRHRKVFAGATEEIHEDMMYDYLLGMQTSRTGANRQMGQGYTDTLQPDIDPVEGFLDAFGDRNRPTR